MFNVFAQITIGGNVYGGGNAGDTGGSTTVTVRAGDLYAVFGGARMANVGGNTTVNLDGEHASADILIADVYGGNDISGTIGSQTLVSTTPCKTKNTVIIEGVGEISADEIMLIVGNLYGGGNGDYVYKDASGNDLRDGDNYIVRDATGATVATSTSAFNKPELSNTTLDLKGGCIAHVYGGGNNATVTESTTINIDNESDDLQTAVTVWAKANGNKPFLEVFNYLQTKVKISTFQSNLTSYALHFARVFGGNNKAPMAIRPKWNLKKGIIRDLYSGGNAGDMTSPNGIYLPLMSNDLRVVNVFGGCRRADVRPQSGGQDVTSIAEETFEKTETFEGYKFPAGYAARVLVTAGDIDYVYGGNDISGTVKFGNAVGIRSSINKDVYGGGNGSYVYTDNANLADDDDYADFYYNPGANSAEALNAFRPNAESVSIHIEGKSATDMVTVGGAVYCGGNSATLNIKAGDTSKKAELKLGKYVITDKVFLGSNGEHMVEPAVLQAYNSGKKGNYDISTLNLTKTGTDFATYMKGVDVGIIPTVAFDDDVHYNTYIGSYYCGGNVGSMSANGLFPLNFNKPIIIYDKVVGGCNNANVDETDDNAAYAGGLTGSPDTNGNKVKLTFAGLKIQPKRWKKDANGGYVLDANGNRQLEWNTVSAATGNNVDPVTTGATPESPVTSNDDDKDRRLMGGNVYGGCYNTGHVNGNVIINIDQTLVDRTGEYAVFDETTEKVDGEPVVDDNGQYTIKERHSGVVIDIQGNDVLGKALNVFGGGYGPESEIWGSTTINVNAGYAFQVFGGGEQGPIGKTDPDGTYTYNYKKEGVAKSKNYSYNPAYSCYVNLKGNYPGTFRNDDDYYNNNNDNVIDDPDMAEVEYLYGGAFEAPIAGNTVVSLGNGRIYQSFGGSCNADILGHTETYVGRQVKPDGTYTDGNGFPWVRDNVYGGNDMGGRILANVSGTNGNDTDFKSRVRTDKLSDDDNNTVLSKVYNPKEKANPDVLKASAYVEYQQGRAAYLFGGCYGMYEYVDSHYKDYTYYNGESNIPDGKKPGMAREGTGFTKPRMESAFVNFRPINNSRNVVTKIYGAGQGNSNEIDRDVMQDRSYVLVDIPQTQTNFLNMEVFGAGDYCGVGMRNSTSDNCLRNPLTPAIAQTNADGVTASTVIDLVRGQIYAAYGGSYKEGFTRRTIVNVPTGSTIYFKRVFGGAYGLKNDVVCDVYDANINYSSGDAVAEGDQTVEADWRLNESTGKREFMSGAVFGGNNSYGRTLYSKINVKTAVVQDQKTGYSSRVFGGGYGSGSWSQYTEVNLLSGASVYEVYGGGYGGKVYNKETVFAWQAELDKNNAQGAPSNLPLDLGEGYTDEGLGCYLVKTNPLGTKTNTNVYINKGTRVWGYCYGGGLGADATVSGTTYIGLHGGTVDKDLYAGGWGGGVFDEYKAAKDTNPNNDFVATTNAYIEGGTVRNVYGGGYQGSVGRSELETKTVDDKEVTTIKEDIPGATNVVIGIRKDQVFANDYEYDEGVDSLNYYKGVPAIQRNAYGAGEGGAVYGTANVEVNNGYIGYYYDGIKSRTVKVKETNPDTGEEEEVEKTVYYEAYEPKLDDESWSVESERANRLKDCGNVFGAGYDDKSSCDFTNITMWGGTVRSCLYGGGEIATVGRGKTTILTGLDRGLKEIYKYGKTNIEMFNGHVKRNVFGGGKGYNILGYGGTNELYTDGYVFGQTEVHIHGGEVGTVEGVADGYGNVFGGGDVGFVYGNGYFDERSNIEGTTSPNHKYFYGAYQCKADYGSHKKGDVISATTYNDMSSDEKSHWDSGKFLTEDCKVVVSPYLQVKPSQNGENWITFDGHTYKDYEYVPTDFLNTLSGKNDDKQYVGDWTKLYTGAKLANGDIDPNDPVERGVIIRNAVFGGGNVSSNSDKTYANATTVFGNSTATLYDAYHRDFITVGTEHTGGLYGGGNLSIVGGYRELNITNYGTDYYGQNEQITLEEYRKLSNRERAYFQLKYLCKQKCFDKNGKEYNPGEKISEEDYKNLFSTTDYYNDSYWEQYGFCSIYAGRLLNTIQRADFCGVYGSRMVLQGAKDRVADVGDNTVYTINRVGEVSLNQKHSVIDDDLSLKAGKERKPVGDQDPDDYVDYEKAIHGNYFGIYSVVNYLGNLTSDVHFNDRYRVWDKQTEKGKDYPDQSKTYENWKTSNLEKPERNKGVSFNQVALASGVFLELTTENSTKTKKDYGYVTGIIELDLINVKKDIEGGGYVYARNQHGKRTEHLDYQNVVLSEYNKAKTVGTVEYRDEARTYKRYTYSEVASEIENYQTSGNFIHKKKRIVDDCYPNNGVYRDGYVRSPAHYWYIKGDVYIYDQLISAYAGSATAYHKEVKIPLTITAASNGKLKLLNVQPNLYAYYGDKNQTSKIAAEGVKLDDESATYHLNDIITWWDWNQLKPEEQNYFVKETYVNVDTCYVGAYTEANMYPTGTYVLENDKSIHDNNANATAYKQFLQSHPTIYDKKGNEITDITSVFHPSNNISHDTGYVLTFDMDSPSDWDDWYSLISGSSYYTVESDGTINTNRKKKEEYDSDNDSETYRVGPTFTLNTNMPDGLYGQREYTVGEIISKEVYEDYETTTNGKDKTGWPKQAEVDNAYVAKIDCQVGNVFVQAGHAISKETYEGLSADLKAKFDEALVCVNSLRVGEEEYILRGELVGKATLNTLAQKYMDYNNSLTNIDLIEDVDDALKEVKEHLSEAYCVTDDGKYGGQYFEAGINYSALKAWCSLPDDRTKFVFNQDAFDVLSDPAFAGNPSVYAQPYCDEKPVDYTAYYPGELGFEYKDKDGNSHTISTDAQRTLTREDFENVLNEQQYFTRLSVPAGGADFYIVRENFYDGGTPFAKGQDISATDYSNLSVANRAKVDYPVHIGNDELSAVTVYYCYESAGSYNVGQTFDVNAYKTLKNYHQYFTVQGAEPTETTTLYVAQESSAKDVTSEKVITVVYQYTYYEEDEGDNEDGTTSTDEGISLKNELHVVNIRLKLESGVPEIGLLNTPPTILPGKKFGMKAPSVNPGLYEIISNGWEIYSDETDAELHRNGMPFTNNNTPVYWYQNQKAWIAFYSRTYLGKTYSNSVKLSVANYHDLDAVMKDKEHHLYVDHPNVMRNSKIYIDNRDCVSDPAKSELDLLKDFFDLSVSGLTGHASLEDRVKGGADLDFILNSDVSPKAYTEWTPIGSASQCFEGTFHGDGYTVSGLDHSLFGHLCGDVYNLGVMGNFVSTGEGAADAGIAETGSGYVENCWVSNDNTGTKHSYPVFGTPTGTDAKRPYRIVNCYYQEEDDATNKYTNHTGSTYGIPTRADKCAFYNGTVAYNLNSFYLNKRYYDKQYAGQTNPTENWYYYLPIDKTKTDNSLVENLVVGYYPDLDANEVSPCAQYGYVGYVEDRYANEDFIYAGGTVPETIDVRQRTVSTTGGTSEIRYAPIWPDDYIFFGQMLTYGHDGYDENGLSGHEDLPSHIVKTDGRLPQNDQSNRVYRAPAYFRSKVMDVAHFNSRAYLAAYSAPKSIEDKNLKSAYPNMTAIDFYGHNDNTYTQGFNGNLFYQPLLDDDGLLSIENKGETPNLLVYAPSSETNAKTNNVLNAYFLDPTYADYTESSINNYNDGKSYGRVAVANTSSILGHLVQSDLKTNTDHLLVDKQDFNCPIAYTMGTDYRMWYQRTPDNFVTTSWSNDATPIRTTKGWESISLPFTAELVTTHQKGELTHFYEGSTTGHEYWLRYCSGVESGDPAKANFTYPNASGSDEYPVNNTFLWDYYYEGAHGHQDANEDTYQDSDKTREYYSTSRNYLGYPFLQAGTPYLIGFPGSTYYEFDLSGKWTAQNTATVAPAALDNKGQTITFASKVSTGNEAVRIGVSDSELTDNVAGKFNNYYFKPNYLNIDVPVDGYVMASDGGSYDKVTSSTSAADKKLYAFRTYFSTSDQPQKAARRIMFNNNSSQLGGGEKEAPQDDVVQSMEFFAKKHKIVVTSHMHDVADVGIYSVSGVCIASFDIQPDETIETPVYNSGVYIIRAAGGHYTKKITIK